MLEKAAVGGSPIASPGLHYWSVQTVDNSLAGSAFAPEQTFVIGYPPFISAIPHQAIAVNGATPDIPFTVGDVETPATNLMLSASSSRPGLVPEANIVFGGSGSNRTVHVTPTPNQLGDARITVTVTDAEGLMASNSFTIVVTNAAPTISDITNRTVRLRDAPAIISVVVGDAETVAEDLIVTASSANIVLVPNANIILGGSGSNRTLMVLAPTNSSGSVLITVCVMDAHGGAASDSFTLTFLNSLPIISEIPDQTLPPNTSTGPLAFSMGDEETPAENLTVAVSSANAALVPLANVVLGGSGSNRTVTVTPASNQFGNAQITIAVDDAHGGRAFESFAVSVPLFTEIPAGFQGVQHSSAAWGDYDNDLDLDLLVTGTFGEEIGTRLYRNEGNGSFVDSHATFPLIAVGAGVWADYDSDGDLDALLTGDRPGFSYSALVYRNDGGAVFTDSGAVFPGVEGRWEWADYDNDGDADLLLLGFHLGIYYTRIYRNEGSDRFMHSGISLPGLRHAAAAWGDYDNDGDMDVLLTGTTNSTGGGAITRLYRNDGADLFVHVPTALPPVWYGSVAWGDYDNDGDLDILIVGLRNDGSFSGISRVYRNNGNGNFSDLNAGLLGVGFGSASWGDFDNDGFLDILLNGVSGTNYVARVYRNEGALRLTDVSAGLLGVDGAAAWGDYDKDGDLDIVLAGASRFTRERTLSYRNNFVTPNSTPAAPAGLVASVAGNAVTLNWSPSADPNQPAGLTYNLRIGRTANAADVVSPLADLGTGFRRLPKLGNTNLRRSWRINNLQRGTYYWSVQAVDHSFAGSPFAPVQTFTVTNVLDTPTNDPPFAQDLSVTTPEDVPVNVTLAAIDVDSPSLTYTVAAPPSHGTLSGTPPALVYTPNTNYFGQDHFTFQASDGTLDSVPATVSITVQSVNDLPIARAGSDQTVECAGPQTVSVLDGRNSSDADGDSLSYSWREGSTSLGTNALQPIALELGSHPITLLVTDPGGDISEDTVLVQVVDTTPPVLSCPTNLYVEFTNEAGVAVIFAPPASDICGVASVVCRPPSGSTFAIGATEVVCTATDPSSNAASCHFTVTVQGARAALEKVLADLRALRARIDDRQDGERLDAAILDLEGAVDPALWVDQIRLQRQGGNNVFHELKQAVHELGELIMDENSSVPDAALQGIIDRLVRVARLLAVVSIQDAIAAGVNPGKIADDNREVVKGDDDASAGRFESAIQHYRNAWERAVHIRIKALLASGRSLRLEFMAVAGESYTVECSTNLIDWVTIGTRTAGPDGVIELEAPNVGQFSTRFYRVVSP